MNVRNFGFVDLGLHQHPAWIWQLEHGLTFTNRGSFGDLSLSPAPHVRLVCINNDSITRSNHLAVCNHLLKLLLAIHFQLIGFLDRIKICTDGFNLGLKLFHDAWSRKFFEALLHPRGFFQHNFILGVVVFVGPKLGLRSQTFTHLIFRPSQVFHRLVRSELALSNVLIEEHLVLRKNTIAELL